MPARPLILAGRRVDAASSARITSPFDGHQVAEVGQASFADADAALVHAFEGRLRLAKQSAGDRRRLIEGLVERLVQHRARFVDQLVEEGGKPLVAARTEVARAIETFTLAAHELSRFGGEIVPVDLMPGAGGTEAEVRRFPAGIVVGIVPFNFPLNLGVHKVAPALAVGAPIIVKPPPQAPGPMLSIGELMLELGADSAAMQVLPCGVDVAERLATDARVRVLSFTGSAKVGWHLKSKASAKAVLELGGNAAAIVRPDADVTRAAQRLATGAFISAGQVCIKVQRIVVEGAAWDSFVPAFLAAVDALPVGDPALETTIIGPVIDERSALRIETWVDEALARGAVALRRGTRAGNVLGATVLTNVPRDAKVAAEEVFGPVVVLERVATFDDAIARVNDSQYGLQAAVFTNDLSAVRRAFHELEVGGVIVNDAPSFRSDAMPYGGLKGSGLGREGVRYAMEDFTEPRVLVLRP